MASKGFGTEKTKGAFRHQNVQDKKQHYNAIKIGNNLLKCWRIKIAVSGMDSFLMFEVGNSVQVSVASVVHTASLNNNIFHVA
jgi:hypothetical protein